MTLRLKASCFQPLNPESAYLAFTPNLTFFFFSPSFARPYTAVAGAPAQPLRVEPLSPRDVDDLTRGMGGGAG